MRAASESPADEPASVGRRQGLPRRAVRLAIAEALLIALADWLLWDEPVGLSLSLFAAATAIAALVGLAAVRGPRRLTGARLVRALVVLVAGLLPMVEHLNLLSLVFGLIGTVLAIETAATGQQERWRHLLSAAAARLAGTGGLLFRDTRLARRMLRQDRSSAHSPRASLLAWIVPITLLATFLGLFAVANPIIARWLADLLSPSWLNFAALERAAFWIVVRVATWPLVRVPRPGRSIGRPAGITVRPRAAAAPARSLVTSLLAPPAILRTLIGCNLLFALQLALDGAYLWGGMALPHHMTYASYAHRGAYPLIATALLSGAFVLVARRPGSEREQSTRLVRTLVLIFTGQTVMLVVSSIQRLMIYIAAYSLTELRLAALVWMLLVAIGLLLIMLQAAFGRSNRWLLERTTAATAVVLYICCFVDMPAAVASYNVDHCLELRGIGPTLDIDALLSLGPDALPALDHYLKDAAPEARSGRLLWQPNLWARQITSEAGNWRAWSARAWRLNRYVDRIGAADPNSALHANP